MMSRSRATASWMGPSLLMVRVNWPSRVLSISGLMTVSGAALTSAGVVAVSVAGGSQMVRWPIPEPNTNKPKMARTIAIFERKNLPNIGGTLL